MFSACSIMVDTEWYRAQKAKPIHLYGARYNLAETKQRRIINYKKIKTIAPMSHIISEYFQQKSLRGHYRKKLCLSKVSGAYTGGALDPHFI